MSGRWRQLPAGDWLERLGGLTTEPVQNITLARALELLPDLRIVLKAMAHSVPPITGTAMQRTPSACAHAMSSGVSPMMTTPA